MTNFLQEENSVQQSKWMREFGALSSINNSFTIKIIHPLIRVISNLGDISQALVGGFTFSLRRMINKLPYEPRESCSCMAPTSDLKSSEVYIDRSRGRGTPRTISRIECTPQSYPQAQAMSLSPRTLAIREQMSLTSSSFSRREARSFIKS